MFNDFEVKMTPESNWEYKYIHIFDGVYISASENDFKNNEIKQKLETNNDYSIEEKKSEEGFTYYVLHIQSSRYHIQIRAISRISLEYLIFHATQERKFDIGRPLTFYPHLSNIESPLEEKRLVENNYRGFMNLLVLALVLSHLRLMYENYIKYGLLLTPKNIFYFFSNYQNYFFIMVPVILVPIVTALTYIIELASSRARSHKVFYILHAVNLIGMLCSPVICHKLKIINPISGIFGIITITIVALKLFSYIHFWYDVRLFIQNKSRLIKEDPATQKIQESIYKEIEEVILNYPNNLSFWNLVLFLCMPVLCYQYKYPTTQKIRVHAVLYYLIQLIISSLLLLFITIQYMLPTIANAMKFIRDDDYVNIIERILKLAIPNVYAWLLMFYAFFHCHLNLMAELTRFGDRTFYKDWWNSLYLDEYWRTWNMPTHYWCMRHIYNPLRRRKFSRLFASGCVFFVSAVFHEYIISGALGYMNYWAFLAMFMNFPVALVQVWLKNSTKFIIGKKSQLLNVMFWCSFCILGQPICMLLYFYKYYKDHGNSI